MNKTYFVTTSDNRSNRKGGLYQVTQDKVKILLEKYQKNLQIDYLRFYNWEYMYNDKQFYNKYKYLIEWINADINGRIYKPYYILKTIEEANEGDFIIYNDVSPEIWDFPLNNEETFIKRISPHYNLNCLKDLCISNNGIACFYPYYYYEKKYIHIHKFFTTKECLLKMDSDKYKNSLQAISGILCFQKNKHTLKFVKEWLEKLSIIECASICNITRIGIKTGPEIRVYNNEFFESTDGSLTNDIWNDNVKEDPSIKGHRHDQSVFGLLINKYNYNIYFMNQPYLVTENPWNFFNLCFGNFKQRFTAVNSNI